jgi:uncharacterized protein YybS (DUF2232 family)
MEIYPSWKNTLVRGDFGLFRLTDVRGGLIAVSLYLLLFFSLSTPLVVITLWFLPLPFLLFCAQNGWKASLMPVAGCGLLTSIWGLPALGILLFAAAIGLIMGELYRSPESTGTDAALGGWVATWLGMLGLFLFTIWGLGGIGSVESYLLGQWEETRQLLQTYGWDATGMEEPPALSLIIPVMLFMMTIPFPLLNLVVGRRFLIRRGFPGKYLPPFREWRLPRSFFYFYFLALLMLLLFGLDGGTFSFVAGIVVTWMFLFFFIQGLSFCAFLLYRWKQRGAWLILVAVLAFLIPFLPLLIHLLGIFDTGTGWRERLTKKE